MTDASRRSAEEAAIERDYEGDRLLWIKRAVYWQRLYAEIAPNLKAYEDAFDAEPK